MGSLRFLLFPKCELVFDLPLRAAVFLQRIYSGQVSLLCLFQLSLQGVSLLEKR